MSKKKFDVFSIGKGLHVADKWWIYLIIPAIVILVALIAFMSYALTAGTVSQGMNIGLDFTGGSALTVTIGQDLSEEQYQAFSKAYVDAIKGQGFNVSEPQRTGSGDTYAIYIKYYNAALDDDLQELNLNITDDIVAVSETLADQYREELGDSFRITAEKNISIEARSAGAAAKLLKQAIIAIVITWALVLIYVIIRFELWSGIAAVIALALDIIHMIAFTIICHLPVNTTFVAALITIVAYSINNTIVVFDRVRDHVKGKGIAINSLNISQEVDSAVQDTFGRSVATTITTLITVVLLAIIGVQSISLEFCLPVIFGLLSGVFTSVCVAPSLYVAMRKSVFKRKEKQVGYVGAVAKEGNANKNAARKNSKKKQVRANVSHKYRRK